MASECASRGTRKGAHLHLEHKDSNPDELNETSIDIEENKVSNEASGGSNQAVSGDEEAKASASDK